MANNHALAHIYYTWWRSRVCEVFPECAWQIQSLFWTEKKLEVHSGVWYVSWHSQDVAALRSVGAMQRTGVSKF